MIGANVCFMHGGASGKVKAAAAARVQQAKAATVYAAYSDGDGSGDIWEDLDQLRAECAELKRAAARFAWSGPVEFNVYERALDRLTPAAARPGETGRGRQVQGADQGDAGGDAGRHHAPDLHTDGLCPDGRAQGRHR
jgi:hypothetical protein